MKRERYSEEHISGIMKEYEAGMAAQDVIRKHCIANGTFYRWKSKFDGMEVSATKRFRELEAENASLKRLLAETMLEETALEDVLQREMVRPAQRREVVVYLQSAHPLSQRRACQLAKLSRAATN